MIDLETGAATINFLATRPTDSSTVLLPFLASQTDISPSQPRFTYTAGSFSLEGAGFDVVDGSAEYNAYASAISQGQFAPVAPGGSASVDVVIDKSEWAQTPTKGLMIVVLDNAAGANEARLLRVVGQ